MNAKLVPAKGFECEEIGHGLLVCRLDGGTITFDECAGKWHVSVKYETMPGYETHMGPFECLNDAGYRMTHGVVPRRLAALLYRNGILVKEV